MNMRSAVAVISAGCAVLWAAETAPKAGEIHILCSNGMKAVVEEVRPRMERAIGQRTGVGIGVRAGAPKPDISTPDKLKQTLLKAKSITYTKNGASAVFVTGMIDRLGIAAELKPKLIADTRAGHVSQAVAEGQAEMVLTLVSEILLVHGLQFVGPLPQELQGYTVLTAGVGAQAKDAEAAKAVVRFLSGSSIEPVLKAKGMEPAPRK